MRISVQYAGDYAARLSNGLDVQYAYRTCALAIVYTLVFLHSRVCRVVTVVR